MDRCIQSFEYERLFYLGDVSPTKTIHAERRVSGRITHEGTIHPGEVLRAAFLWDNGVGFYRKGDSALWGAALDPREPFPFKQIKLPFEAVVAKGVWVDFPPPLED